MQIDEDLRLRMDSLADEALCHWGGTPQVKKAIEEMAELTVCLARHINGRTTNGEIQLEIADCFIVLNQMAHLFFDDQEDFERAIAKKLAKLERALDLAKALDEAND